MATISKLVVSLSANSAKLVAELAKAKKSVGKWARDIRAKANTVAKVMVAAGAAAAAAIAAIVNRQTAEIDKLAKKAAALDIDTGNLQKLRYQAGLSGVASDALDKSLQKMLKTISDGKAGLSTAKRAFEQLGLSVDQLSSMNTDEQFYAIAEAMKGIPEQADKTRIAMDIFGRSGGDLLNTFGSDLGAVGEEFEKLGIRVTSQQAAMVEAYSDSKDKLGAIWDGFLNKVTMQVAPAFQMVVDWISKTVIEFGGMDKVATKVVNGLATAAGFVADAFYGWGLVIKNIQVWFGQLAQVALKTMGFVYERGQDLRALFDSDFKKSNPFYGLADGFSIETARIDKELDAMLSKGRPSLEIDAKLAKIQADVAKAGEKATVLNTDSSKQNTAATNALTDALGKDAKAKSVNGGAAWERIFKQDSQGDKKELKISTQFADYAKALKASINRGDSNSMAYFVEQAQRTLDAVAGRGPNGLSFGNDRDHDIDGMQSVLDKLVNQMQQKPEQVGSIDINVAADGKTMSGKLMGDPAFLKQLKTFVDKSTNQTARAVAR